MLEGMAHLMGLRPPPDDWVLASLGKQYGVLPSRLKPQDYHWLGVAKDMGWLQDKYHAWTTVGAKNVLEQMTPEEMLYLSALKREVEKKWRQNEK